MTLTPENRWTKGKSDRKYVYTIRAVAELSGKALQTVRNDISKGKLDMTDIISVCRYIGGKK